MMINRIALLTVVLSASVSVAALASEQLNDKNGRVVQRNVEPSDIVPAAEDQIMRGFQLQVPDIKRYILSYGLKDKPEYNFEAAKGMSNDTRQPLIDEVHRKDEDLYKLALVTSNNWQAYEKIAFDDKDIQLFAQMAIDPAIKDKMKPEDVINFFGLNTRVGRMKFRNEYGAGMPEMILQETGARGVGGAGTGNNKQFIFNQAYLNAKTNLLGKPVNAKKVQLIDGNLRVRPKEIGRFENLEVLWLYDCSINYLPTELLKLKNLKELILQRQFPNGSQRVQSVLTKLVSLEVLDLSANEIKAVPPSISNLINLKKLNLAGNRLKSLPESMVQLQNLEELNVRGNREFVLPNFLNKERMSKLTVIRDQ